MHSVLRERPRSRDAEREEMIDTLVELYVTWRERAAAVASAYDEWAVAADTGARRFAFAVFRGVLDDEALAAQEYADFAVYVSRQLDLPAGRGDRADADRRRRTPCLPTTGARAS